MKDHPRGIGVRIVKRSDFKREVFGIPLVGSQEN
jgi:hypothetical protein